MDTITLNKNNRLFWLGRYSERVYQGVLRARILQDSLLDSKIITIEEYCVKIGFPKIYGNPETFFHSYLFNRNIPESIISSADYMLGNGMVLRELLGTVTLSYLQMSINALEIAEHHRSNAIQLQWVLDDIMAFRGSFAEFVDSETVRNVINSGASVERVSTMLRFGDSDELIKKELKKLFRRAGRSHIKCDSLKMDLIVEAINSETTIDRSTLISCVETLFVV